MITYYKGFKIEPNEGLAYVPKAPKLQITNTNDCDALMNYCDTLHEAKEIIEEEINKLCTKQQS